MSWGQTLSRAGWRTAAGALVSTGLGIAVNLATSGTYSGWVWVAVGVLTVGVFGVSLLAQHNQSAASSAGQFELGIVEAGRDLRVQNVRSQGGFRIRKARSGQDMEFRDIEPGRGDASHP
jgi:hypothetical protein